MASDQENEEKLNYAARLSGLLLNEGTDVMRWFLLDNLPRVRDEKPDLKKLLQEHREMFEHLRDDPEKAENFYFGHEMFDILFPPNLQDFDDGNLEISLIFALIRILCKMKHPSWRWWDEDPQSHQTVPIFDIIRLARFKRKMKNVVHKYEINKETYEHSLEYVTGVMTRLRGFKMSARRWEDDVIAYEEDEAVTKERKTLDLVTIMRWQTLPIEERNEIYLVLKKNFYHLQAEHADIDWTTFISYFGQMRALDICKINELEEGEEKRYLVHRANNLSFTGYNPPPESEAKVLNWHLVHDAMWKKAANDLLSYRSTQQRNRAKSDLATPHELHMPMTPLEQRIYASIDDKVFITGSSAEDTLALAIQESWKKRVIETLSHTTVFPGGENDKIPVDSITVNISEQDGQDIQQLETWTDIFQHGLKHRIVVNGTYACGKSTFLQKIAYQCATNNCPALSSFDIVFFIDLAKVKVEKPYSRIVDCIKQQCLDRAGEISTDDLERWLNSRNGRGILFMFDHLEDFKFCDETFQFSDVLKSELWPECSIIRTKLALDPWENGSEETDVEESGLKWRTFYVHGFKTKDVITEVQRVFSNKLMSNHISTSRHILNLIRLFQRDLYQMRCTSPVLTALVCRYFKDNEMIKQTPKMPETIGKILDKLFSGFTFGVGDFEKDILKHTLNGRHGNIHVPSDCDHEIKDLIESGVVRQGHCGSTKNEISVRFAHPWLQDYFSARTFCALNDVDLEKHISSCVDAMKIRNFLKYCCEINPDKAETILHILTSLIELSKSDAKQSLIALCFHCFYVSNFGRGSKSHGAITASIGSFQHDQNVLKNGKYYSESNFPEYAEDSDLITANLVLENPHKLSHRTRHSILKFAGACRPCLTSSGTVIPLLTSPKTPRSSTFIRHVYVSDISSHQIIFVASLISSLHFLETLSLTDIATITCSEFEILCSSLKPSRPGLVSPLHSLKISFNCETHFDKLDVPTFEALGEILRYLPFLESLNIEPLTYKNLASVYDKSERTIPIEVIGLSQTDIDEKTGQSLKKYLARSPFTTTLDLSHNRLRSALSAYEDSFLQFKYLKVINLEECCLSAASIQSLASCLKAPRLSSTVTSLCLRGNHIDNQMSLLSFASSIGCLKCLQRLDLSKNFLRNRVICVLSSQFHKLSDLRELILDYVQMGDLGLSSIRSNISYLQKLELLSLGENPLPEDAVKLLFDMAGDRAKLTQTLKTLKISGISNEIPLRVSQAGVRLAADALRHYTSLLELNLTCTNMNYSQAITMIKKAEEHESLRIFRLSDEMISLSQHERNAWSCLSLV